MKTENPKVFVDYGKSDVNINTSLNPWLTIILVLEAIDHIQKAKA